VNTNSAGFFVPIPLGQIFKLREEVRNAIWLYFVLTDWATEEFEYAGIRVGAVFGGAKLCDSSISDRVAVAFGTRLARRLIRRWREALIRAGLIVQHRIPWGYQIAVIGTRKSSKMLHKEHGIPYWIMEAVDAMTMPPHMRPHEQSECPKMVSMLDRKRSVCLTENGQNILDNTDKTEQTDVTRSKQALIVAPSLCSKEPSSQSQPARKPMTLAEFAREMGL
jgi:hypothetical protein